MTLHFVMLLTLQSIFFVLSLLLFTSNATKISARMSLNVHGKGFHRTFEYQVEFTELAIENCHIALYLELPTGVYVNVDELADLRRLGKVNACSFGETDVELFMEKAQPQYVTVCSALNHKNLTMKVPIHQRYQYASPDGSYTNVTVTRPKLLLGCKNRIRQYRVSKIDLCSPCVDTVNKWREIPYHMDQSDYIWSLPVGNSSLLHVVTYVTLAVTVLGAVFILRAISKSVRNVNLKED